MIASLDTNILVGLWGPDPTVNIPVRNALSLAKRRGRIVLSPPVFAEALAARDATFVDGFLEQAQINVEWELSEIVWRAAGQAFQEYAARRKSGGVVAPRRILADFVIGAHANENKYSLMTLDDHFFRLAFPSLKIVSV